MNLSQCPKSHKNCTFEVCTHEIYKTMIENEIHTFLKIKMLKDEKMIKTRQRLVDYIVKVYTQIANSTNRISLISPSNSVIHLAITYLDIILSVVKLQKPQLKIVALSCLSIASKFDELDQNIPLAREFIKYSGLKLSYRDIIKNESMVLQNYLNWDLNVITVFHFAECLLSLGIIFRNDSIKEASIENSQLRHLNKRVYFFVDLSTE